MEANQASKPDWLTLGHGEIYLGGFKMSPSYWSGHFYLACLFSLLGFPIIEMVASGLYPMLFQGAARVSSIMYLLYVVLFGYIPLVFLSIIRWKLNFIIVHLTSERITVDAYHFPVFRVQYRTFELSKLISVSPPWKWEDGNTIIMIKGAKRKIRINLHLKDRDEFIAAVKGAAPHIETARRSSVGVEPDKAS